MRHAIAVGLTCWLAAATAWAQADLVLRGGPIHTAEDAAPTAEAVAVDAGRIVYVGAASGAEALIGPATEVIELNGAALYPGFTDAHAHLLGIGLREMTLNLEGVASLAALVDAVRARVAGTAPGAVIAGRGWIETHWPEARFPTAADLDAAAPDNPVILTRADGHALVANSAALARAGIDAATPAPAGGDILRDASGRPTGMLIDKAMDLLAGVAPQPTPARRQAAFETGAGVYARYGWTGVHNMSVDPADLGVIALLADQGRLPLRVYNSVDRAGADALLASGAHTTGSGRVITRAIKLYADGALGSRGAALFEPYGDADTTGLLLIGRDEILPILTTALRRGIQVNTHAIGDRANRLVLDWYGEALAAVPAAERAIAEPRWRIEHAQVVHADDHARFAELGVIASMQPSHAISDLHFAPDRLGLDSGRLAGAYAWASLLEAGAIIAGGSDAPVERGDPAIEFYAAVARRDLTGYSGPGWHPDQAVDRQTALKMFTLWPAYAAFQEDALGSIAVGKRADFTALSHDIMTVPERDILQARAVLTVVDGAIVHRADGW